MTHVFRGRTLIEARTAAEDALGGEIVVLDRKKVKRSGVAGLFGGTEFEITAGIKVPPAQLEDDLGEDLHVELSRAPKAKQLFARGVYDDGGERGGQASRVDVEKLNSEVRAMRGVLHSLKASPTRIHTEIATLRRAVDEIVPTSSSARLEMLLTRSGLEGSIAGELRRELNSHDGDNASLVDAYRDALADRVRVRSWPLAADGRKVIGVVGAPGVGKTTTAAKLAARAVAEGKTVSFVGCDTYRVGAVEQLRRYAELLEIPVDVARTQEELHAAVRTSSADIVIVDTSGRGPDDEGSVEAALANGVTWGDRARHVLFCLEASTRYADTERLVTRFRLCGPTGIAVTKIDLAAAPCGLINGTLLTELAVSVLCDGQRVPEDISPATAGRILDHIAPHRWANSRRFQN